MPTTNKSPAQEATDVPASINRVSTRLAGRLNALAKQGQPEEKGEEGDERGDRRGHPRRQEYHYLH